MKIAWWLAAIGLLFQSGQAEAQALEVGGAISWIQMDGTLRFMPVPHQDGRSALAGARMASTWGVGIEANVDLLSDILLARVRMTYAPTTELYIDRPPEAADPPEGGGTVPGTYLVASAAMVYRPFRLGVVSPYVSLGGGLKRFEFDQESMTAAVREHFGQDRLRPALLLGGGLELATDGFTLSAELADAFSRYPGEPAEVVTPDGGTAVIATESNQHDLLVQIGLRFPLR